MCEVYSAESGKIDYLKFMVEMGQIDRDIENAHRYNKEQMRKQSPLEEFGVVFKDFCMSNRVVDENYSRTTASSFTSSIQPRKEG